MLSVLIDGNETDSVGLSVYVSASSPIDVFLCFSAVGVMFSAGAWGDAVSAGMVGFALSVFHSCSSLSVLSTSSL